MERRKEEHVKQSNTNCQEPRKHGLRLKHTNVSNRWGLSSQVVSSTILPGTASCPVLKGLVVQDENQGDEASSYFYQYLPIAVPLESSDHKRRTQKQRTTNRRQNQGSEYRIVHMSFPSWLVSSCFASCSRIWYEMIWSFVTFAPKVIEQTSHTERHKKQTVFNAK